MSNPRTPTLVPDRRIAPRTLRFLLLALLASPIWSGAISGQAPPNGDPAVTARRAQAEAAVGEGEKLYGQGTVAARRQAIEKYEAARRLFHELNDVAQEAAALNDLGAVYDSLGDKVHAREFYTLALPLRVAAGDRQGEAVTLNNFGTLYRSLGQLQMALQHYRRSLEITRAIGDRESETAILNNLGTVYRAMGEMQQALSVYGDALPLWKALGNKRGEAVTLSNLGGVYRSLGEQQLALDLYQQSLVAAREAKDRRVEGETLNNIGAAYRALKTFPQATEYFTNALAIRREVGDRRGEASTIGNLGSVAFSTGDYVKALELYEQSLALWRALGDRAGEALMLNNIGETKVMKGDRAGARPHYLSALTIRQEVQDRVGEAGSLASLARLDRDEGNLAEARRRIESTLTIVENLRGKIANPDLRASYFATVQEYYDLYVSILMRAHVQDPTAGNQTAAFLASERSRARSLIDLLAEARTDIREGVSPALLAREQETQDRFNTTAERYTRILSGKHTPQDAEGAARELNEVTNEYDLVQAEIRQASPRYVALARPDNISIQNLQTQILDRDTLLLEYKLGDDASYLWAVSQTSLAGFTLAGRREIDTAARRVYELLTARNQRPVNETPTQRQARLRQAEADYPSAANELSKLVLGPLGPLRGVKRLVIVADGALQYIPFQALAPPAGPNEPEHGPLLVDYEVVHLPSVSVLSQLRRGGPGPAKAGQVLAVLADPVFDQDDPRVHATVPVRKPTAPDNHPPPAADRELERALNETSENGAVSVPRLLFSRQEADAILRNVPANRRLAALNFNASRVTATSTALSAYRYLHFATHGLLNSQHPELSGVVLSLVNEQGRAQDGFLRLHDIYQLRLNAELVVLSACQTGLGREVRGEGLIGLTRGFMYAGAPRVVASLWKVDDAATAELMSRFYRGILKEGKTPAAALRAAQIEMWQQPNWRRSPFYWAAFVLQGDWK